MTHYNKAIQEEMSDTEKPTQLWEDSIEYYLTHAEFKFCYLQAQDPDFAENLVDSLDNKEIKK